MKLYGGTWNMERDRDRGRAARQAIDFMQLHQLDFLLLQEANDYLRQLRHAARAATGNLPSRRGGSTPARAGSDGKSSGYRLFAARSWSRGETAILLAPGVAGSRGRRVQLTTDGWRTVRGGTTPPKYLATVVADDWLQLGSGHEAPSVRWRRLRMIGPKLRRRSVRVFGRRLVRWLDGVDLAVVVGCDWNATPHDRGPWTPKAIATQSGAQLAAPEAGTHGRRVIDYPLFRDCRVDQLQVHDAPGDHQLVTFRVVST